MAQLSAAAHAGVPRRRRRLIAVVVAPIAVLAAVVGVKMQSVSLEARPAFVAPRLESIDQLESSPAIPSTTPDAAIALEDAGASPPLPPKPVSKGQKPTLATPDRDQPEIPSDYATP